MANYPNYGMMAPQMPQMAPRDTMMPGYINGYQQQQVAPQAQQTTPGGFICKPVTSREEAVAASIDFFGPGTLMPDFSHGMVYFKRFNQQTGAADFLEFAYQPPRPAEPAQPMGQYVTVDQLRPIVDRLDRLEGGMTNVTDDAE